MTILRAIVATLFAILVITIATALAATAQYPLLAVLIVCAVAWAAVEIIERARP